MAAHTATTAAGPGLAALAAALERNESALAPETPFPLSTWTGRVPGLDRPVPLAGWDCRATRLAALGLQADGFADRVAAERERCGAARIGVVIGTSASTIAASEAAYRALDARGHFPPELRNPALNTPHALALFVQAQSGLAGPCVTVSTACSSGAKAWAVAERWLRLGWCDAVVAGGVDALGASLLYGFRALGLVSNAPCRPFDAARAGISLGEAAAFALLRRGPGALQLQGWGESNDAHHMSSPHPQGRGAERALDDALARAGLAADAVDFVNLHGTASAQNDEVEAALVARRYRADVHACATKGLSGHTMGAAGALEASICLLALEHGLRAGSAPTAVADPALGSAFARRFQTRPVRQPVRCAASHSFGFGGNNAVLVLGRD